MSAFDDAEQALYLKMMAEQKAKEAAKKPAQQPATQPMGPQLPTSTPQQQGPMAPGQTSYPTPPTTQPQQQGPFLPGQTSYSTTPTQSTASQPTYQPPVVQQGLTASEVQSMMDKQQSDFNATIAKQQADQEAKSNALKEAQKSQAMAGLDKARSTALSNLSSEQAKIEPQAYNDRNSANIAMNNQAKSFSEFLAMRGLSSSGQAGEGAMRTGNQYQGQLGTINANATLANQDINKRATEVGNNYASDVASANAGIEATALQNAINQMNADKTFNYNSMRDNISDQRYNTELTTKTNDAALSKEIDTIDAYKSNFQAEIDRRKATPSTADDALIPYLESARQKKISATDMTLPENQMKQLELQLAQMNNKTALVKLQQIMAVDPNLENEKNKAEIARIKAETANVGSSTSLGYANLAWEKDPSNPDNIYKQAQTTAALAKPDTVNGNTIEDFAKTIQQYYYVAPNLDNEYKPQIDTQGIKSYLESLQNQGVDQAILINLASRYGIVVSK